MEGAALLRDEPPDRAVFLDDVMRADPGFGIAQPIDRFRGALHAGVVQHQHVDGADVGRFAAAAVVRRKTLANFREGHAGWRRYPKNCEDPSQWQVNRRNFAVLYHGSTPLPTRTGRIGTAVMPEGAAMLGSNEARRKLLRSSSLFSHLSDGDADAILVDARLMRYPAGTRIFAKGDPGNSMMAVLHGRVMISNPSPDGRQIVVTIFHDGDVFGEIALLDGK